MQTKYIFVTGGVVSSLGKGLTAASVALLLERKGRKVAMLKLDPYLNVDPGTMNPFQHGEVYVTDDGAETDLDLGHYHRYCNTPLSRASNATSGQIYNSVIRRERRGDYLGNTVQVIPHITDEIKQRIIACAKQEPDIEIVLVEIGGTVGDIESLPFMEAIRQFRHEHAADCMNIHLTYVPYLRAAGEVKTKPTQHSVQGLRAIGISPDIICCRCDEPLSDEIKSKISLFCNVPPEAVIDEPDVKTSIYEVPMDLKRQGIDTLICRHLGLPTPSSDLTEWEQMLETVRNPKGEVTVGIIGKYVQHQDAYKSVYEALHHGALAAGYRMRIRQFEADKIATDASIREQIAGCDGYLVPGGFGERGWRGKIEAARFCREEKIPYLGICLGMHILVSEFANNIAGLKGASSTEIDADTEYPVISLLSEQEKVTDMGGTMRLGAYPCTLSPGTHVHKAYGTEQISERHRHRYEFNNKYKAILQERGLIISGSMTDGDLTETVEIEDHPWMVGVQFHPEFKSKPTAAHPLFRDFVKAMIEAKTRQSTQEVS